jgi:hypothetical protein
MQMIIFQGLLHGTPPTLGTALLVTAVGIAGLLNIILKVAARKRRDFTWPQLLFHSAIVLFLVVVGLIGLFKFW